MDDLRCWLLISDETTLSSSSGDMLFDVVHAKLPSASGFDGWFGMFLKHFHALKLVEATGTWPDNALDAYIVVIPKDGADVTPIGLETFESLTHSLQITGHSEVESHFYFGFLTYCFPTNVAKLDLWTNRTNRWQGCPEVGNTLPDLSVWL